MSNPKEYWNEAGRFMFNTNIEDERDKILEDTKAMAKLNNQEQDDKPQDLFVGINTTAIVCIIIYLMIKANV